MKDLLTEKYESEKANLSNREINKIMKTKVKKLKSPDTDKMIALNVPHIRATFFFKSKKALKRKIEQLKTAGLEFTVE